MPCIPFNSGTAKGFICTNAFARLHVGNRYFWISWYKYCGVTFYHDYKMTKEYVPEGKSDPIWDEFGKWLKRINFD